MYKDVNGAITMAPVYDVITTWAYIPKDSMALTIDGSTKWPDRRTLIRLAQTRSDLSQKRAEEHMEATADAMSDIAPHLREYFIAREGDVGARILEAWEAGIRDSLGLTRDFKQGRSPTRKPPSRIAKSDGLVLEHLRQKGGSVSGTLRMIAEKIGIPQSTLSTSIKRLAERGFIERSSRRIAIVEREV
jgi:serine/threonine-protein kinase HipA